MNGETSLGDVDENSPNLSHSYRISVATAPVVGWQDAQ